ncbi:ribonuclease H-like domain-containing protein [Tanacetum coccineum]
MANLEFYDKHNMLTYLKKSEGSEGFHQIIDFLNASHIQCALTENLTIYVSFIKQFWRTATARTSANGEDNGGVTTLPNSEIFEQPALMGYVTNSDKLTFQKGHFSPQWSAPETSPSRITSSPSLSPQHTPVSTPSTSQPPNTQPTPDAEEAVPMPHESPLHSVHSLGRDEGSLSLSELTVLCTNLSNKVTSLEAELAQTKQTYGTALTKLIKKVKKLEQTVKSTQARRRFRIVVSDDEEGLEDPSKQGRKITEIDQDPSISLVQDEGTSWIQEDIEIQEKISDDTEVVLEEEEPTELVEDQGSGEKGEKEVSTVGAEHSTVIPEVSTAAANLVYIRRSAQKRKDKGKAIMEEDESSLETELKETKQTYNSALIQQKVKTTKARRRARIVLSEDEEDVEDSSKQGRKISAIDKDPTISLVQPEQEMEHDVGIAEEMTWFQNVDAEIKEKNSANTEIILEEEQPTELVEDIGSGEKGTSEVSTANIVVTTAEVSTAAENLVYIRRSAEKKKDKEAVRLQEQLNEEETQRIARDAEIARQLHKEINKAGQERVVAKDDQAHVIDWSDPAVLRYHAQLNRPYSVAEVWDQIQSFAPMDSKKEKGSEKKGSRKKSLARKRAGEKQSKESTTRQKIEDDIEKEELKSYLDLVPREEFDMEIESLDTKYPIVDWKTHVLTENFMYYQIIRADEGSKNYKIFNEMLDDFDRQDVMDLHRLVEERYATSRPEGYNLMLWGDLKILFQPDKEDEVWRHQHEYNLISWRLFDLCGIHILLMDNGIAIHMMIEKKYPLTQEMLSKMLSRKLEVDHENEMAFELLKFIRSQANCNYHQKERVVSGNNYTRVNYNYFAKKAHPSAHRNMTPRAVLMKNGLRPLNTARPVNTAHHKTTVHSARPMPKAVNTARPKAVNIARPKAVNTARPNSAVVNTVRANQGHPQKVQEDQGYVDSRCSRHMIGNMSYLSDFKEFNRGYVTFGGGANGGKITGKGTLKTDKLDFEDVYFVKELKFNLFSLPDESRILLRVPRKNNMYSVDMKNIVPKESLTSLVAKATLDESILWHRRLGIRREFSVARTPQQNGVAERRNRTLIEAARTMLADFKLPTIF